MFFRILADLTVLVHFLWIVFLFFGALWGVRNKWVRILHLSGFSFAILIQIFGWYCPLTHLEFWLNSKHVSDVTYTGSFIIHYVERLVYLELSPTVIFLITILLLAFNVCFYFRRKLIVP